MKRRDFLKVTAAAATSSMLGCAQSNTDSTTPITTEEQRALKRQGRSLVALVPVAEYDDNISGKLFEYEEKLSLPSLTGKKIVIKPNIVEYRNPETPVTTNAKVVKAAIEIARHLGAIDITVAEGPGHMRDTEYLLDVSGIGQVLHDMKIPFVDLNLDDIVEVKNITGFNKLNDFYLPKTIVDADAVISVPKLKTHHWVGVTCSMKNLFGVVPGRKYGWPKNLLHRKGIGNSIIDLVHMVRPIFGIVDGIVAMEGDGPINGTPISTNVIGISKDLAALDATMTRVTGIDPLSLQYLLLAGLTVGNIQEDEIDIVGAKLAEVKKQFKQPITLTDKSLLKLAADAGS
ncbi:MAG: DUF362 domain-containing protein [Candidatus Obscuribacterales bacterium]|nr:DUF362 domain-containing protein [Candidatus Obscuribacterales bacterium]